MANRIISFGTTENLLDPSSISSVPSLSSFDVYKDINMQSIYSGHSIPTIEKEYENEDDSIKHVMNLIKENTYETYKAASYYITYECTTNIKNEFKDYISPYSSSTTLTQYQVEFNNWRNAEMNKLSTNYRINLKLWNDMSKWSVDKSINIQAIFNSLRNIFTWNQGERILLPEFGSRLHMLLYEGITPMTEEAIIAEIRSSVSEWEPRIQITSIVNASTVEDTEDNVIHIQVMFIIPALGNEEYAYDFSYTMGS